MKRSHTHWQLYVVLWHSSQVFDLYWHPPCSSIFFPFLYKQVKSVGGYRYHLKDGTLKFSWLFPSRSFSSMVEMCSGKPRPISWINSCITTRGYRGLSLISIMSTNVPLYVLLHELCFFYSSTLSLVFLFFSLLPFFLFISTAFLSFCLLVYTTNCRGDMYKFYPGVISTPPANCVIPLQHTCLFLSLCVPQMEYKIYRHVIACVCVL